MSNQGFPQQSSLALTVQAGPNPGQQFNLKEGVNTVGRDPSCEIYLADPSVSRSHARIVAGESGVWIEDTGSANGTFVNGQRVVGPTLLKPGDDLRIGTTVTLTVAGVQAAAAPGVYGTTMPGPSGPSSSLVVQSGPQPGAVFGLSAGVQTIGRGPGNQIVIADPAVSKQHARVSAQPDGSVWVEDLGSSNGTFVNGQRVVGPTLLKPGDVVQVGTSVTLGFRPTAGRLPPAARGGMVWPWVLGGALALVVLLVGGAAAWFFMSRPPKPPAVGPLVQVYQPESNADVMVGEPMLIYATARDEMKVKAAELWVNGQLAVALPGDSPGGTSPFVFVPAWMPLESGPQSFVVRAYSTDGRVGQSRVVDFSAIRVVSEEEFVEPEPYIVQEGDTIESIARELEVSAEEIIQLNPEFEEIAKEQDVPVIMIVLPPEKPINVPKKPAAQPGAAALPGGGANILGQNPPAPQEPTTTNAWQDKCNVIVTWNAVAGSEGYNVWARRLGDPNYQFIAHVGANQTQFTYINAPNGEWEYYIAVVKGGNEVSRSATASVKVTGCQGPPGGVQNWIMELQFAGSGVMHTTPDKASCYVTIGSPLGPNTLTQVEWMPPEEPGTSRSKTMTLNFPWQPTGPLLTHFSCLYWKNPNTKPVYIGFVATETEEAVWRTGKWIHTDTSKGGDFGNMFFRMSYRVCPAPGPCKDWQPGQPAQATTKMTAPTNLRWGDMSLPNLAKTLQTCFAQVGDSVACANLPINGTSLLFWDWNAPPGQTVQRFEVWVREKRPGGIGDYNHIVSIYPQDPTGKGSLGELLADIIPIVGCETTVEYYVKAVGPDGEAASAPIQTVAKTPKCTTRVKITFEDLTVTLGEKRKNIFGLYANHNAYVWSSTNELADGTYKWANLAPDPQKRVVTVDLSDSDDLTIGVAIMGKPDPATPNPANYVWCDPSLVIKALPSQQWAAQYKNHPDDLPAGYPCKVKLFIDAEVLP